MIFFIIYLNLNWFYPFIYIKQLILCKTLLKAQPASHKSPQGLCLSWHWVSNVTMFTDFWLSPNYKWAQIDLLTENYYDIKCLWRYTVEFPAQRIRKYDKISMTLKDNFEVITLYFYKHGMLSQYTIWCFFCDCRTEKLQQLLGEKRNPAIRILLQEPQREP